MCAVSWPELYCKCYNSRYRSGEPCIGHVSSCIHNRSPFIPLSSTYSRFIHWHSPVIQSIFHSIRPSIPRFFLSLYSHSFYYSSLSLSISLLPFFPCTRTISKTLLSAVPDNYYYQVQHYLIIMVCLSISGPF